MDSMQAFAMGEANRGKEMMVFDWDQAARIIKERGAQAAAAGLRGDWGWTGGPILCSGRPVPAEDTYTYLASTWAVPELEIDGERLPCFRMESETPGWGSGTYWPQSSRNILETGVRG